MSCGYHQSLAVYVAVFLGISMLLPPALGAAQFSKTPSSQIVKVGDNVSIVWDYSVGNRDTEFQQYSPVWSYYDQSGTKYELASEDKFDSWKWKILPTCPTRLKHRLSKADTATLVITNVSLADSGKYQCSLSLISGSVPPSSMQLTITDPPVITTLPDNTTVTQGDDIILKCQASGNPPASISWSRDNNVPIKPGHTVSGGTLTIPNVVKSDAGKYICTANNIYDGQVQTATAAAYVTVRYPPSIVHHSNNQIINETDSLSLTCTADGYPVPTITWTKSPGTIIPPNTGNMYTILSVKRSDTGTYTCTASNGIASDAMTSIQVTVQYKPSIDKAISSTNSTIPSWKGNTITLKCVIASGLPSPNFTWYKPNNDVIPCNQCSRTVSSQVTVQTGQDSGDYGLYICIATNVVGSDQHYINVNQLFPPGRPNITVTDIEASSVIVRWTKPVYDGGSPVIQYKLIIDSNTYDIDAPNTHKSISGLTKNTKYEVKLYAKNIARYGSASSTVFTTKKQGPPFLPEFKDIYQTSVTLVWSKPDENGGEITKYTIYKKVVGVDGSWSKVVDVTATSYTVEDLDPGKKYSFIVTASNQYGESLIVDSKANTVVIPVETTTTTTTTVAVGCVDSSSHTSADQQQGYSSTVVGVLAAFLAVSLLVIVLLVLYIWRITRRTKSKQRKTDNLIYENVVEMAKTSTSSATTLHVPPANQPGFEYESVEPSRVQPQYERPQSSGKYEIPDNRQTSQDTSHYQQLNPSTRNEIPGNPDNRQTILDPSHYKQLNPSTITSQHGNSIGMYEPLRLKPMDVRTGRRGGSKTEDIQQNTSFT